MMLLLIRGCNRFGIIGIVLLLLSACTNSKMRNEETNTRSYTDMSQRTIIVPSEINRIVSNNSPGSILLYTLADSLMVARNNTPSYSEKQCCTSQYCNLPVIGGWFGSNGTKNTEELIRLKPDVIISAGNTNKILQKISDKEQVQFNIPIVQVSTNLLSLCDTYKKLGNLLHREKKAEQLIGFINRYIPDIIEQSSKIPMSERKRVYFAIGENGLQSSPRGSLHSQVISLAGGVNVVDINKALGHVNVSLEQLIRWNPQVILSYTPSYNKTDTIQQKLINDKRWSSINAIKNQQVYTVPHIPYCWLDMPPSVNQVIGLIWLSNLLYPDIFSYDVEAIAAEFYDIFYHYKPEGNANYFPTQSNT